MTSSLPVGDAGEPAVSVRPLALSRGRLVDLLTDVLEDLEALRLDLGTAGVQAARQRRRALVSLVRDNLLPRLADADVPAVVVVGGSTGAGKSTLVNSVLGQEVSDAGVLRPTTRVPVLVVHPEDAQALAGHPLSQVCRTVVSDRVPAGLAVVDASDLDSVQEANRSLAARLLEAADLWLFITTAARYGDLTPWETLEQAAGRGTTIAVVLNRAPAAVLPEVRRDLMARLAGLGLAEAPFFVVPDAGPHEGLLTGPAVEEVAQWLALLAGRHRAAGLLRRADQRVWETLRRDLVELADEADEQEALAGRLQHLQDDAVRRAADRVAQVLSRGEVGEGAVATRWVSAASTGGPLAALAQGRALRRGWLGRRVRARQEALASLAAEACHSLGAVLAAVLEEAGDDVVRVWAQGGLDRARERLEDMVGALSGAQRAARVVDAWHERTVRAASEAGVAGLPGAAAGDLVCAAVVGVAGARAAAGRLGLEETVTVAGEDLAGVVEEAVLACAPRQAAALVGPEGTVAAALRLRAGELTPLTRPGGEELSS